MGCERVEKVRAEDVEKVILRLRDEGKRWKTVRDYVGCLRHFFNWGMRRGYWDRNPVAAVELPQRCADSVPRRALTPQEIKRLLDACPNKERRLLYLTALYTGLRLNELRKLTWQMVDLEGGWIRLPAAATKAKKSQSVPLHPALLEMLREHKAQTDGRDEVFRIPLHLERHFRRDLKRAGIKAEDGAVSFHSLRHTFATLLARNGVSAKVGQELLRHADVRLTLQTYTHCTDDERRAAVEGLPWLLGEAKGMEAGGFEPPTCCVQSSRSPSELRPPPNK